MFVIARIAALAAAFCSTLVFLVGIALPEAAAKTPSQVRIDATQDGKPVTEPITWTITKLDKKGKPESKPTLTQRAPVFQGELVPGQYVVLAQASKVAAKQAIFVGEGEVKRTIVLGTAQIKIELITARGREPVKDPVNWELRTYAKGNPEGGVVVDKKTGTSATFVVPAGGYVVRARYQGIQADLVVPLSAGQAYDYTLNLYAGHGRLSGWRGEMMIKQNIIWQIVREKPNANGEHELVATTNGDNPTVMMREGRYLVIGRAGNMWGADIMSIESGNTVKARIQFKEGEGMPKVAAAKQPETPSAN